MMYQYPMSRRGRPTTALPRTPHATALFRRDSRCSTGCGFNESLKFRSADSRSSNQMGGSVGHEINGYWVAIIGGVTCVMCQWVLNDHDTLRSPLQ